MSVFAVIFGIYDENMMYSPGDDTIFAGYSIRKTKTQKTNEKMIRLTNKPKILLVIYRQKIHKYYWKKLCTL